MEALLNLAAPRTPAAVAVIRIIIIGNPCMVVTLFFFPALLAGSRLMA
jgi:hypothetical protein